MMGSTEKSFIAEFIKHSSNKMTPAKIKIELEGMEKWHKIIGSTPPAYFDVDSLHTGIIRTWVSEVVYHGKPPAPKDISQALTPLEKKIYIDAIEK